MHARSEPPQIDFDGINATALAAYPGLLQRQFPAGRMHGREFVLGDLSGAPGESLSVNSVTGKWSDFATDQKGGDPISLWAAAFHGGDRVAAAKALRDHLGLGTVAEVVPFPRKEQPEPQKSFRSIKPPADQADKAPLGRWDHAYPYRDAAGELLFYVVRKDAHGDTRKVILPLAYGDLNGKVGWHQRHASAPRPLYGLDRLTGSIGVIVMHVDISQALSKDGINVTLITHGEHKADGARFKPLPEGAKARIQATIDAMGEIFDETVARNRGISAETVKTMEAGTFFGPEGVAAGLADAVMSPDQAFLALLDTLS